MMSIDGYRSVAHPGLLAPASLKHPPDHGPMGRGAEPHPGLLAPASLKHAVQLPAKLGERSSSGAACPGLIEATAT